MINCTSNNFQVDWSSMAKSLSPWPINVCTPPEMACTSSTYRGHRQVSRQKIRFPWPPLPHVQDGFPDFVEWGGGKTIIWNLFKDLESASQSDIYFKLLACCNAFAKYLSNRIIFPSGGECETTLRLSLSNFTSSSSSSSSSAVYMLTVP